VLIKFKGKFYVCSWVAFTKSLWQSTFYIILEFKVMSVCKRIVEKPNSHNYVETKRKSATLATVGYKPIIWNRNSSTVFPSKGLWLRNHFTDESSHPATHKLYWWAAGWIKMIQTTYCKCFNNSCYWNVCNMWFFIISLFSTSAFCVPKQDILIRKTKILNLTLT